MSENAKRRALLEKQKNGYDVMSAEELKACHEFNEDYKYFIDAAKTEREAVDYAVEAAKAAGFKPYKRGDKLKPGDKIYQVNRGKAIAVMVIGQHDVHDGINISGAHIDSPRIDLKMSPLFEDHEIAFFKTHYYGGIKKYQWVNIPLELHGVIALKDGTVIKVRYGDKPEDPIFIINDLLIHLSAEQMKKGAAEVVPAESMNAIVGTIPDAEDDGSDRVKLAVMGIINDMYGITEADFHSAELTLVPAMNARDVGFDRSLIAAYGHDDRVCAYDSLRAVLDTNNPTKTIMCLLVDKEEIGSTGVSGANCRWFDTLCEDIAAEFGMSLRECFERSFCLSNDVAAAFDPNYPQPFDPRNAPKLNYGLGVAKYTGSRGKSGASDASAELVARVRNMFDNAGVLWQMAPLGAVDAGGGGTIAGITAQRNIDTIDAGVPVLSMHAPYEIISKVDNYMSYKGMLAVFNEK